MSDHHMPLWKHVVAGGSAGVAEVLVMYPLDVVKTRNQTLKLIIKEEGALNMYRGIISPILAEAPKRAIKFSTNEIYKDALKTADGKLPSNRAIIAGGLAGVTEAFVNCPFEVVKVRMQAKENLGRYTSTSDCAIQLVKGEGPLALYKGLSPQMWRNAGFNGAYFGLIGTMKNYVNALPSTQTPSKLQTLGINFLTGLVAGAAGVVFATPFDVVKSRMQNQLKGQEIKYRYTIPSLISIFQEGGLAAVYKGFVPRLVRLGPGGGIMIVVFDLVSGWLK